MVQLPRGRPIIDTGRDEIEGTTIEEIGRGPIPEAVSRLVGQGTIGPLARKGILMGVGMARSPVTQIAVEGMIRNHFFVAPDLLKPAGERAIEFLDALDQAASMGTSADDMAGQIGEIAPEMVASLYTFGAGRLVGRGIVRGAAEAFPKGKTATAVRAKAAETVTDFPVATPRIQQLAEIVGGNVGFGAGEAAIRFAGGDDRSDSLTRGALAFGVGLTGETVFRGIGKLARRGRELRNSPEFPEGTKKAIRARLRDVRSEIRGTNKRVTTLNETLKQQIALEDAARGAVEIRRLAKQGVPFVPKATTDVLAEQVKDVLRPGTVAKKIRRTIAGQRTAARDKLAQTTKRVALEDLLDPNPSLLSFVRAQPAGGNKPPGIRAMMRVWHGLFSTPQGLAPKLGPMGFKLFQLLDDVGVHSFIGRARWSKRVAELREMGNPDRQFIKDAFELYEAPGGSVEAVTARFGQTMGKLVASVRKDYEELSKRIVAAGGQPAQTADELARMKVGNFLAHVHKQTDEGSYIESGAKAMVAGQPGLNIEAARARMMEVARKRQIGPRRFGGIDFQRAVAGTTQAQVRAGVKLIDDPLEALFVHAQEIEHRLALSKNFGFNAGLVDQMIEIAGREGADTTMLFNMAQHMLGFNYHDRWMNSFARVATNWQAFTKMTWAIIPNMFQPIANNPLVFGAKASARELFVGLRKEKPVDIEIAIGLMDPYLVQLQRSFEFGERRLGITGILANAALVPFQAVERWNRWLTGNTAYSGIMQILARAEAGALRGKTLDQARRTMFDAGLDLTLIARQGPTEWLRNNPDELLAAIFRMTRRTQFIPSPAIRPIFWSHPFMRVVTQFATFALNQGRLMKDLVIGEMGHGNFGPAAYVLSIHPLIGELTTDLQALAKGRARDPNQSLISRVFEDFANVGSMGIGLSLMKSFQFSAARRGISAITGPFLSDLDELVENAAAGNIKGIINQAVDLPVVSAAIRLYQLGDFTFDALEPGILGILGEQLGTPAEPEDEDVPTLQELQRRQKEQQP